MKLTYDKEGVDRYITKALCTLADVLWFWLIWNWLAPTYLAAAPAQYQHLPYWHIFFGFILVRVLVTLVASRWHREAKEAK